MEFGTAISMSCSKPVMKMCPACNGLSNIECICLTCGSAMIDLGRVENLYGPYSPYSPDESDGAAVSDSMYCQHALECPNCSTSSYVQIHLQVR
jgi:hypothetical protein